MLSNPRHEKIAQVLAREIATKGEENITKRAIYEEAYPSASPASAAVGAARVLSNANVISRAKEIVLRMNPIEIVGKDLSRLRRFRRHIVNKDGDVIAKIPDGQVQLSAVQTCLKIHGVLSDAPQVDARSVAFHITPDTGSALAETLAKIEAVAERLRADA